MVPIKGSLKKSFSSVYPSANKTGEVGKCEHKNSVDREHSSIL